MHLPFTPEQFFAVFGRYNEAVWPAQILFVLIAVVAASAPWIWGQRASRAVLFALAVLWFWIAIVYHAVFFRPVNPAASVFAALFLLQGIALTIAGLRRRIVVQPHLNAAGVIGLALIVYALIAYPVIGYFAGHRYPYNPTFGLPCPTTLYTVGVLLWVRPLGGALLAIPLVWCVIGSSAAFQLGVYEDGALLLAVVASISLLLWQRRSERTNLVGTRTASAQS